MNQPLPRTMMMVFPIVAEVTSLPIKYLPALGRLYPSAQGFFTDQEGRVYLIIGEVQV